MEWFPLLAVAVVGIVWIGWLARRRTRRSEGRAAVGLVGADMRNTVGRRGAFEPFMMDGSCDVCNASVRSGEAFLVPVSTFYGSSGYRAFLKGHPMVVLLGGNVDAYIAQARAIDSTTHSAVCQTCLHMFR